jgi:hypothetical protein
MRCRCWSLRQQAQTQHQALPTPGSYAPVPSTTHAQGQPQHTDTRIRTRHQAGRHTRVHQPAANDGVVDLHRAGVGDSREETTAAAGASVEQSVQWLEALHVSVHVHAAAVTVRQTHNGGNATNHPAPAESSDCEYLCAREGWRDKRPQGTAHTQTWTHHKRWDTRMPYCIAASVAGPSSTGQRAAAAAAFTAVGQSAKTQTTRH